MHSSALPTGSLPRGVRQLDAAVLVAEEVVLGAGGRAAGDHRTRVLIKGKRTW
jgi:hypothetical protein